MYVALGQFDMRTAAVCVSFPGTSEHCKVSVETHSDCSCQLPQKQNTSTKLIPIIRFVVCLC
jgi:hypothetical protein